MSFICQKCKTAQKPRTKGTMVVTKIRNVEYPAVKRGDNDRIEIPRGFEIVEELLVCPACANSLNFIENVGKKVLTNSDNNESTASDKKFKKAASF